MLPYKESRSGAPTNSQTQTTHSTFDRMEVMRVRHGYLRVWTCTRVESPTLVVTTPFPVLSWKIRRSSCKGTHSSTRTS